MTPDQLAERYDGLNEAWFGGRLPDMTFRVSRRMTMTAAQYDSSREEIAVALGFVERYPERVDELILHEMVHVATLDGHGQRFRRQWQRLLLAGAPVADEYREFRHCPQFVAPSERPHLYMCPLCSRDFPRMRPFGEPRWCGVCVGRAERQGIDPYARRRALRPVPKGQGKLFE